MDLNIVGITQARIGSSRLPSKVLMKAGGKTILEHHLRRAKKSRKVNSWVLATTFEEGVDELINIGQQQNFRIFQGSSDNVLDRFYQSVKDIRPDYVVRITSDCPLIDGELIDLAINTCIERKLTYFSNSHGDTLPDGVDVEVFTFAALEDAWKNAVLPSDLEHVVLYIRKTLKENVKTSYPEAWKELADLRLTVDEPSDLDLIQKLIEKFGGDQSWIIYARAVKEDPALFSINQHSIRNEGFMKSIFKELELRKVVDFKKSDEYRASIHKLIPGGAHTYSKGDDQFPLKSPAAFSHGKGSHVWDIDGNEFLDCSMGLGSVSLGHAFEPILERVREELSKGVNFQRPSVIEKTIAENFLSLVPQHDMIKFAKNGSIVTTAAVKLGRAKTGRKLVAFPFDHPFYSYDDWFIGKTGCNKGVPDEISALSVTFKSCDIESLRDLFRKYPGEIACVITEPEKQTCVEGKCSCNGKPGDFLRLAIDLAHENGALFIMDEMVSGFKTDFPGSIKKFNLEPDMATWGKGIANGFSFCALTGKRDVMELGGITNIGEEKVFLISTTHGGETHSLAAAIATIDFYKKESVIERLHQTGKRLIELTQLLITKHGLGQAIEVIPTNWTPVFLFKDASGQISPGFRTLFMQEMISHGVHFQGFFVPSFSHTEDDLFYFAKAFETSMSVYAEALKNGYEKYLVGEPAKAVFRKIL